MALSSIVNIVRSLVQMGWPTGITLTATYIRTKHTVPFAAPVIRANGSDVVGRRRAGPWQPKAQTKTETSIFREACDSLNGPLQCARAAEIL
jgi:hypothetical protein